MGLLGRGGALAWHPATMSIWSCRPEAWAWRLVQQHTRHASPASPLALAREREICTETRRTPLGRKAEYTYALRGGDPHRTQSQLFLRFQQRIHPCIFARGDCNARKARKRNPHYFWVSADIGAMTR